MPAAVVLGVPIAPCGYGELGRAAAGILTPSPPPGTGSWAGTVSLEKLTRNVYRVMNACVHAYLVSPCARWPVRAHCGSTLTWRSLPTMEPSLGGRFIGWGI